MTEEKYDIQDELEQERKASELDTAEYHRLLELMRTQKSNEVPEVVMQMINAPSANDPLDEDPNNIDQMIKYMVGHESQWSSGGAEAKEFSKLMRESFDHEWKDFNGKHPGLTVGEAMQKLPPVYYASPLPAAQNEALIKANPASKSRDDGSGGAATTGAVRARVHYHDNHGHLCEMMREITFSHFASVAIAEAVERIHTILNISGVPSSEYMFKVVGRAEYIYGSEMFINFRYIRDCVVKMKEVKLYVLRLPFDSTVLTQPRFLPSYNAARRAAPSYSMTKAGNLCSSLQKEEQTQLSLWDIPQKLQIRLDELQNLTCDLDATKIEDARVGDDVMVCVIAELTYGGEALCPAVKTPWRCCKGMVNSGHFHRVLWGPAGVLTFDCPLQIVPREARISMSIMGVCGDKFAMVSEMNPQKLLLSGAANTQKQNVLSGIMNLVGNITNTNDESSVEMPTFFLAAANVQVFDFDGRLRSGSCDTRLWFSETKANPITISSSNPDPAAAGVRIMFPTFALQVVHPSGSPSKAMQRQHEIRHNEKLMQMDVSIRENKIAQLRQLKSVLSKDPLHELTETDKLLLWTYRNDLTKRPKALSKFLLAVDWASPAAVDEAHQLMERWAPLQPMDALELLDARYADTKVRIHAIEAIDRMRDNELKNCILQLVQVLKYEPYHFSALSRFLLKRSLGNPTFIGHTVFWHLMAEMSNAAVSERHGLLIQEYLLRLPSRRDLLRQHFVVQTLLGTALRIKESKKAERLGDLRESLEKLTLPPTFGLALDPTMECCGLHIGKCKVMDSKKLPLWLVFKNSDPLGPNIYIIFKAGDDLRQDLLTLQMLELMDNVWKGSGLDLHMIPYGCVATGEGVGMIEVVLSSDTVANITKKDGGAHAAFSETPLMNWLRKYNRTTADVERCLWNFVYSCAGYCVATYILGIGDRHNDNIMLREDGTMFHIDFGHFLGNFKTKFGIKRETAPFIFTPMYAYMMGGPQSPIYEHFCEIACRAYNVIRRSSNMLIVLFTLMLSTGIPELQSKSDIMWLQTVLLAESNDEQVAGRFRDLIADALANRRTLVNDYVHIVAHS